MLNLGTWLSPGGERLLRFAWANGVRYFDTAKSYGSEPMIGRWLQAMPVRPQGPVPGHQGPARIRPGSSSRNWTSGSTALQTDYVDLIFLHALGDTNFDFELQWPRSQEFKEAAEAIRKSGKAKFVGFSTHHPRPGCCSRPPRTAGSSTRSCSRTTPGSPRKTT